MNADSSNQPFGVTLPCVYRTSNIPWPIVGEIYECYIERDLHITHPQMPIANAVGTHKSWKNNAKVFGFYARSAEVFYFPNELEKIFPNLRLIAIAMSRLKDIKQRNLMAFDQLQYLCLFDNAIEVFYRLPYIFSIKVDNFQVIEKHLFAYNILLEAIDLRENRIVKINVNVFDYLINLQILYTSDAFNSSCVSTDASDRESVIKLISDVKHECNERAIIAKSKKITKLVKVDEEQTFIFANLVTEAPKVINTTEKALIEKSAVEVSTEMDVNEEENVIEDEFRASAVSAGSTCSHGCLFLVLISILLK